MILKTKNVGKLYKEAQISLNGITVLAGENGTGKSTLGKVLYCVFNTLFEYDSKIQNERERSLLRKLSLYYREAGRRPFNSKILKKPLEEFFDIDFSNDDEIRKAVSDLSEKLSDGNGVPDSLIADIKSIINTSDDDIANALLRRRFESEFNMQIGHVDYQSENSEISLVIKDESIDIVADNEDARFDKKIKLVKDLVYIDDPYVVDGLESMFYSSVDCSHRADLKYKLLWQKKDIMTAVDDAIVKNKLDKIYMMLDSVCDGVITEGDDDSYQYSDSKFKKGISTVNVSTGMKGFIILRTLLKKGYLEENGIVILDEPEAHLHPEWMVKYAEIVILLHNVLGINFLISTHSSEFLCYIQRFAIKYESVDKCNFYMLKDDPDDATKSVVQEIPYDQIDEIYETLTEPFIKISKELDMLNE